MSRIGVNDAFRHLSPDDAVVILNEQTRRADGKLDLWCNGNPLPRNYIRQALRFELGENNEIVVIGKVGVGGWERVDHRFRFELDADQVEALTPPPLTGTMAATEGSDTAALIAKQQSRAGRRIEYDWPAIEKAIRAEYGARKSKTKLAAHVRVRLEAKRPPIQSPSDSQLRKLIAKLFPDDAQN
jgi:hypothetical protein